MLLSVAFFTFHSCTSWKRILSNNVVLSFNMSHFQSIWVKNQAPTKESLVLVPESLEESQRVLERCLSGGGGGGTQMLFGRGCAADAAKPVPNFKGHFGRKGYQLLGVWRKRVPIIRDFYSRKLRFVYFSDEMGENI